MGNANRVPQHVLQSTTGQQPTMVKKNTVEYIDPLNTVTRFGNKKQQCGISTNQDESIMRAMFKKHVDAYTKLNYRRGSYLLHSFEQVKLLSTEPIPPNVGVGLVSGKMKYDWPGKVGIVESLEINYGPREIVLNCIWFDADNPLDHPDKKLLKLNRRFAVITYKWYYPDQLPKPTLYI